ncbi:hypothetical protein CC80DRAFT_556455 [Byssothecium circinans]|uniref:Uncharacterized protein n=1 Tax=Byssothecium circinans TaxID=147558 RepID=A0A6A5T6N4_9PLEO|nr:hypothetical protein CC80DRAFT_556455 [Byssothecium circinans]
MTTFDGDNVCDVPNMTLDEVTPLTTTTSTNGFCSSTIKTDADEERICKAYCELRISVHYGREELFKMAACTGPQTCTVNAGESISYTSTWDVNMGFSLGKRENNDTDVQSELILKREDSAVKSMEATFKLVRATATARRSRTREALRGKMS